MPDSPKPAKIAINRAPVLTLWAAIVAERLGHDRDAALTLGRSVAGVNAQSKGRTLGIFDKPSAAHEAKRRREEKLEQAIEVELLGRVVRAKRTRDGLRALDRGRPSSPEAVERYLESKFGDALAATRAAMMLLAEASPPDELATQAFGLYERFRPSVPSGSKGWGAAGELDLELIRSMAKRGGDSRAFKPPDGPASASGAGKRAATTKRSTGTARTRTSGSGVAHSRETRRPAGSSQPSRKRST